MKSAATTTSSHRPLRVGLFGIGLDSYWPQFKGLKSRLEGYVRIVAQRLARPGMEIVNLGLIDSPPKAMEAGHRFRQEDVDIIFLHVTTYALSSTVLPVVRRARVPVVVLNLQPVPAIDYASFNQLGDRTAMTGEWLAHCGACPMPEIANVFNRSGIPFHQVTGMLHDDPPCWNEVDAWIEAARVAHILSHNRLGLMGHYYCGMLDIASDITQLCAGFGGHVQDIEVDELAALRREVPAAQIKTRVAQFRRVFEVQPGCPSRELARAARTSVALDRLVKRHDLGSLAYYYMGAGNAENAQAISTIILGNSLLTARGIPVAGEYEVKNVVAVNPPRSKLRGISGNPELEILDRSKLRSIKKDMMKIMDSFKAGGSFTEFYAMDFKDDVVLMGHDGPGHIGIAQGKTKVRPLQVYHGKWGGGLSVEMSVKHGPVTLLSVVQTGEGKLQLLVAEAESVPGPILEIGNTNSRYRFSLGARQFVNHWNSHGPAHHCAVGLGHLAEKIEKLGRLLQIQVIRVC